jgi:hypothetical protein
MQHAKDDNPPPGPSQTQLLNHSLKAGKIKTTRKGLFILPLSPEARALQAMGSKMKIRL